MNIFTNSVVHRVVWNKFIFILVLLNKSEYIEKIDVTNIAIYATVARKINNNVFLIYFNVG
jgi:hypothetical protein